MAVNLPSIQTRQERALLRTFRETIRGIKDQAVISEIVRALEVGDVDAVLDLLQLDEAAFQPIEESIRQAYLTGGLTGAEQIGSVPGSVGTLVARFNVRNPAAEQWLRDMSSRLVTEVFEEQRTMIRDRLVEGMAAGRAPRSSALDLVGRVDRASGSRFGGYIGLTARQSGWVSTARDELNNLDPNYLTRELRDKRLDGAFKRAIESGKPMKQSQIDSAVTNMQARALRYRGESIARTESLNALRAGQNQAIAQAVEQGIIDIRDLNKIWDDSGDIRTRLDHLMMGQTYSTPIPFDEPFIAPDGSRLMFPGDTSMGATAKQTIRCRCKSIVRFSAAGKLRRIEGFG